MAAAAAAAAAPCVAMSPRRKDCVDIHGSVAAGAQKCRRDQDGDAACNTQRMQPPGSQHGRTWMAGAVAATESLLNQGTWTWTCRWCNTGTYWAKQSSSCPVGRDTQPRRARQASRGQKPPSHATLADRQRPRLSQSHLAYASHPVSLFWVVEIWPFWCRPSCDINQRAQDARNVIADASAHWPSAGPHACTYAGGPRPAWVWYGMVWLGAHSEPNESSQSLFIVVLGPPFL